MTKEQCIGLIGGKLRGRAVLMLEAGFEPDFVYAYLKDKSVKVLTSIPPLTFKANGRPLKNYRIYGNTVNGESVGDPVTEGEHAGEYRVPVTVTNGTDTQTTNLYLPEQIKTVGGESEYIDYKDQKQYRVRKNLLYITSKAISYDGVRAICDSEGVITLNGTSNNGAYISLAFNVSLPVGTYILTGGSEMLTLRFAKRQAGYPYDDSGDGKAINCDEPVTQGVISMKLTAHYTYENFNVYPMIRKSSIDDDTFEPYIENTDIDVTLPALPTLKGKNTLSVGTTVQPSKVEIKYKR